MAAESAVGNTWAGGALPPSTGATALAANISSTGVQRKGLTIGAPNDRFEREADRMADNVMSAAPTPTPAPSVQAKETPELQTMEEEEAAPSVQRKST